MPTAGCRSIGFNPSHDPSLLYGFEALLPFAECLGTTVGAPYFVDLDVPAPAEGYAYLVTRTASGVEGSLGFKTDGAERQIEDPCP